jgi:hypothetical protein
MAATVVAVDVGKIKAALSSRVRTVTLISGPLPAAGRAWPQGQVWHGVD